MSRYGAKCLQFAPFSGVEPTSALPTYGAAVGMSELVNVNDNPEYNTAEQWGDDKLCLEVAEFKKSDVEVECTEISVSMYQGIYGAKQNSQNNDTEFGGDDTPPYGGLTFYSVNLNRTTKKKEYIGVFYPKLRGVMQGENYKSKGDSISIENGKVKFTAYEPNYGKWKILSPVFQNEADAKAWCDAKLGGTAYHSVRVSTNGAGAGESTSIEGVAYVANTGSIEITITGTPTALYDNGTESVASIASGVYTLTNVTVDHDIVVVF